jgi:hypothetical protein
VNHARSEVHHIPGRYHLDVGEGKCASVDTAQAIIDDSLGARNTAVRSDDSGNGLHPYWPIIDGVVDTASPVDQLRH